MYIYIYEYTHVDIYICVYMCVCIYMYIYICIYTHAYATTGRAAGFNNSDRLISYSKNNICSKLVLNINLWFWDVPILKSCELISNNYST